MKARKFTYHYIITIFAIYFNVLIIIFPKEIIKSAKNGLLLWYNFALPSLLPFIIGTNILKSTNFPIYLSKKLSPIFNKIFKISGNGAFPIVCGMLSGYPLGAKLTCDSFRAEALDILHAARKKLRMPDPHFIGPHRQVQSIEYIQIILQRNADLAPLPFLNGALVPPQHIRKLLLGSARHVPGKGNGFPDSVPVVGHILSLLTHTCTPGIPTSGDI